MGDALTGSRAGASRALLVADAGDGVGLGHLSRCTALAEALGERGFEVEQRVLTEEDSVGPAPDVLVIDTYDEDAWGRLAAKPHGVLASFEDALPEGAAADLTIGGLRLACLRRPFWDLGPREIRERPDTILVTSGGSYLDGLAARVAVALRECAAAAIRIELVWASGFPGEPPAGVEVLESPSSLLEPLLRCDAVVCTGGQTLVEAAATGAPALALEGAANQRPQIASLATQRAVIPIREDEAPEALERLLADAAARQSLSTRAQEIVDGRGALRVAAGLEALTRP